MSKRCGRYFVLGRWLLSWLEAGVTDRQRREPANGALQQGDSAKE